MPRYQPNLRSKNVSLTTSPGAAKALLADQTIVRLRVTNNFPDRCEFVLRDMLHAVQEDSMELCQGISGELVGLYVNQLTYLDKEAKRLVSQQFLVAGFKPKGSDSRIMINIDNNMVLRFESGNVAHLMLKNELPFDYSKQLMMRNQRLGAMDIDFSGTTFDPSAVGAKFGDRGVNIFERQDRYKLLSSDYIPLGRWETKVPIYDYKSQMAAADELAHFPRTGMVGWTANAPHHVKGQMQPSEAEFMPAVLTHDAADAYQKYVRYQRSQREIVVQWMKKGEIYDALNKAWRANRLDDKAFLDFLHDKIFGPKNTYVKLAKVADMNKRMGMWLNSMNFTIARANGMSLETAKRFHPEILLQNDRRTIEDLKALWPTFEKITRERIPDLLNPNFTYFVAEPGEKLYELAQGTDWLMETTGLPEIDFGEEWSPEPGWEPKKVQSAESWVSEMWDEYMAVKWREMRREEISEEKQAKIAQSTAAYFDYEWEMENPHGDLAFMNRSIPLTKQTSVDLRELNSNVAAVYAKAASYESYKWTGRIKKYNAYPHILPSMDLFQQWYVNMSDLVWTFLPPSKYYSYIGKYSDTVAFLNSAFTMARVEQFILAWGRGSMGLTKKVQRRKFRQKLWGVD